MKSTSLVQQILETAAGRWLYILLFGLLLIASLLKSIRLTRQYPNDLRNRIVGARLQEDGISPYFYHWQSGDPLKYYDATNYYALPVSNITASPFYHWLIGPVSKLSQRAAAYFFLALNYMMLLAILWLFWRRANAGTACWIIPFTGVLFTLGSSWHMLMQYGQLYFQLSFFLAIGILGLWRGGIQGNLTAAIGLAIAVLIKPTALIIAAVSIVLFFKRRIFLVTLTTIAFIFLIALWSSPFHRSLWKDYWVAIKQHANLHLQPVPLPLGGQQPFAALNELEGFSKYQVEKERSKHYYRIMGENANLSYWLQQAGIRNVKAPLLFSITLGIMLLLISLALLKRKSMQRLQFLLLAWLAFLLVDYTSPVLRGGYVGVQWIVPILLMQAAGMTGSRPIIVLLIAGMILQIFDQQWIPMRQTASELCFGMAMMVAAMRTVQETSPSKNIIID